MTIVLIGPPGSGKGTQAARIREHFGIPIISSGDILRAAVRADSPLGRKAASVMAAGGLVDDGLMIDLVRDRLTESGTAPASVLDGFPRTPAQANALDVMPGAGRVIAIALDVPRSELKRRLLSRRICPSCNTLYTTSSLYGGSEEEHCSRCRIALIHRDDDNVATVTERLRTYAKQTRPLIQHYRKRSALVEIDGSQRTDAVWAAMQSTIASALAEGTSRPR